MVPSPTSRLMLCGHSILIRLPFPSLTLSELGEGPRTGKAGLEIKKNKDRTFVFQGWVTDTNLGSQEPGFPHNQHNRDSLSRTLEA